MLIFLENKNVVELLIIAIRGELDIFFLHHMGAVESDVATTNYWKL